jgi:hypothetical protein
MSRIVIVILIYHRSKSIDLSDNLNLSPNFIKVMKPKEMIETR